MKIAIIFALAVLPLISAFSTHDIQDDIIESEWIEFKEKFNKNYKNEEEHDLRKKKFIQNRYLIARHHLKSNRAKISNAERPSFELGLNEYADMSIDEFKASMNGFKAHLKQSNGTRHVPNPHATIPVEIDWRKEGLVTPVKDQKRCGSCWAFSATGALEGQTYKKTKKAVSLSEQNLVDCSKKYGNNGCEGGLMDNAFEYIKDNHGIDYEDSYPYEAKNGKCRYKAKNKGSDDIGFADIPAGDEDALLEALATVGPISIAIDASQHSFQLYRSGVYDEKKCSSSELDHGVLLVGYGTDEITGKKYWLVKNSWGSTWGEKGYIKILRGHNLCGVASMASYPLV